jgi:hypothetical protein
MPEMTIGYKILRVNPAAEDENEIADLINEHVRIGYKIEHIAWLAPSEMLIFLYRNQPQA